MQIFLLHLFYEVPITIKLNKSNTKLKVFRKHGIMHIHNRVTIEYTIEKRKEASLPHVKIINFTGEEESTCKGAPSSYRWAVNRAAKPGKKLKRHNAKGNMKPKCIVPNK